ncbi:MAG: 30S ribosomal protein S15 [Gammaproteobacteria bacterium]|nr:30S ribosomal protein S15 [Gammaproteobacteria bacterium]
MAITSEQKGGIVQEYQRTPADTGSPEVQVALLSARIEDLTAHFKVHSHDVHSRQGLLKMVNKRRKLLDYLRRTNAEHYKGLISRLGLRK